MLNQKFSRITDSPLKTVASALIIWAAVTNGLFLISDRLLVSLITLMLCFGLIYPVFMTFLCFKVAKRHGILWYYYTAVILVTAAEYAAVPHFKSIIPNIIVLTLLCLIFGCGIGNCFADKALIDSEKEQRRLKKLHEDKAYTGILDTDRNKSDKRNGKRK